MITLAALIVVADLAHAGTTVEQRVFQIVRRWRNRLRNPPKHHLQDRAVIEINALVKKSLSLRHILIW